MPDVWNGSQEVVKFAFKPTGKCQISCNKFASTIVDKMVSWLPQSFTKSFTYSSQYSVLAITAPRCLLPSAVIFTLELANKFGASINFAFSLSEKIL